MTTQAASETLPALTLATVRSFHADPATQAIKDKLFLARAKALIVREDVDALLEPAFAETDYRDEYTGERITCLLAHASKHFAFDFTCQHLDLHRRAVDLFSSNVAD